MARGVALCLAAGAVLASSADLRDLQRARAKVPRMEWKGATFDEMSVVLNGHLTKMFPKTKPCHEWTATELQAYQAKLYDYRHPDFDVIYNGTTDNRRMRWGSLDEHQKHWARMNGLAKEQDHLKDVHRDGHCHEAVMWLVHHVPTADQQTVFARMPAPLLSNKRHSLKGDPVGSEAEVHKEYAALTSCADCHSGSGIIAQDYSDIDGVIPEDPEYPGMARQRRCDQNYKPVCGPCEGIGGPYWGDKVSEFQPTNCEVVALPEDVPVDERLPPQFPEQFIVHQLGSDRLARTQNAARFALYSQIRSTLWYDFPLDRESEGTAADGMAKLRHDTFYDDLGYKWLDHGLVTEIHMQSRAQREANITGPMVSMLHGLLGWGKYMGGLTCLADPVGVPVLGGTVDVKGMGPHASFIRGADYKGRIKIGVEYAGYKLGDPGNGDMKAKRNMTVDHYVKWFLHLFVDADKTSPTYREPIRFYGPYSGFAVYIKLEQKAPPEEVWTMACPDNGWPTDESKPLHPCTGKKVTDFPCMVVEKKHPEVCKPWDDGSRDNEDSDFEIVHGAFGSLILPKEQHGTEFVV